ncbi:MAG: hypothetical protein ACRDTC_26560 [Pseudonocardiaceae bacterium]
MMGYLYPEVEISTKRQDRTVRGVSVVRKLKALDGVWVKRIRAPGQQEKHNDGFTIHQVVFARSLRPLLDMPVIAHVKPVQIALLLNAYWEGIAKVLPEPFDSASNPQDYMIQKDQGAVVLHSVLPYVIEVIPSLGKSLTDPIAYADVMHDLPMLSGEIVTDNGVELVSDASFWLSGPAGVASRFSGDAGCECLSSDVRALIPRPAEGLEI